MALGALAACAVLLSSCATAQPSRAAADAAHLDTARGVDYLSTAEKDLLLEINKLRSDPARYADMYLAPRRGHFSGRLYRQPGQIDVMTNEGVAALDECIAELKRAQPRGPLRPSRGLSQAADDHATDQGRSGGTGHTGSDGSSSAARMERYGDWGKRVGENISYGYDKALDILFQLVVDDGVPSRGHRRNLMHPDFAFAGLAIGRHPKYDSLCVMDFAGEYTEKAR